MEERFYWLGWQLLLPGSGKKAWQIINHFGGPELAWYGKSREFANIPGMTAEKIEILLAKRSKISLEKYSEILNKSNVCYTSYIDADYPQKLKDIYDPPLVLFYQGQMKNLTKPSVALVGSRKATAYGKTVAERLSYELAEAGVIVVSGMARGIDTVAHLGTIAGQGLTLAVLGCGLNVIYPPENGPLKQKIMERGLVFSEFPLGSPPEAWHFPCRNRIISGLSDAVIVIEAGEKSGALITADFALEQGRDVMAVPGSIFSQMSKGPLNLIKQGAKPITKVEDILEEFKIDVLLKEKMDKSTTKYKLNKTENKIIELLSEDPVFQEDLLQKIKLPPAEVMSGLMFLEMKGLIKKMPGKMYAVIKLRAKN